MIKSKLKKCDKCLEDSYIWGRIDGKPFCKTCYHKLKGNTSKISPKSTTRNGNSELEMFKSIYESRNGICDITGEYIEFDIWSFAHVLSKKAYPSYRLNPENIIFCKRDIHILYDCSSKDKLLEAYPDAILFYQKKDELRYKYYNE